MGRISTGAATAFSSTPSGTQDVNLTKVGGTSFALGQQLAASSLPVVLTAAQLSTLTPLATVAVTQSTSPWVVAGGGTAGSAATGVVTIQGITSMTPVQVSQATASNLNATVVGTGTFAVQAASATAPVSTMNSSSANSGLNSAIAAVFDDSTPTSISENNFGFIRMSANRNQYVTLRDAAGNERGLNVDANGAIAVTATNATASNLKVAATLDAETTKVIGTVRNADGAGNLLTSNSTTYTAKFGLDSNLLGTLGTAFSTAGKVDVKAADGDVFVRQATASNLNATVVGTGTFATQSAITAASGSIASGAISSGAVASGAFASGSIASGAIAVGAIAAGDTSIATTEDTARAGGEHLVKVGLSRLDTPVANANVSNDGDYTNFIADNFGKAWVSGTVPEDTAHVAGEALTVLGARRIDTVATSAGSSGDWATVNQTAEGALWVTVTPSATGGATTMNATSSDGATALTSTAQVIKASAGTLKGYYIYNPNSSAQFVQFYNVAAASVTVGTTNPLFMLTIPATSAANLWLTDGIAFSNAGWSWAATSTAGGNGAPSTALDAVCWYI